MTKVAIALMINQCFGDFIKNNPKKNDYLIEDKNKELFSLKQMLKQMEDNTLPGVDFRKAVIRTVYWLLAGIGPDLVPDSENIIISVEDLKGSVPVEIKEVFLNNKEYFFRISILTAITFIVG